MIRFDRRGIGLSDPLAPSNPPTMEQLVEDVLAVMDAAGSQSATCFADGPRGEAVLIGATHPGTHQPAHPRERDGAGDACPRPPVRDPRATRHGLPRHRDQANALDAQLGIEVRAGLHTGEVELFERDVGRMTVNIGARVAALADGGEVLVSRTVADLVVGSGLVFVERGSHELKGVPGTWTLLAVAG